MIVTFVKKYPRNSLKHQINCVSSAIWPNILCLFSFSILYLLRCLYHYRHCLNKCSITNIFNVLVYIHEDESMRIFKYVWKITCNSLELTHKFIMFFFSYQSMHLSSKSNLVLPIILVDSSNFSLPSLDLHFNNGCSQLNKN